MTVEAAGAKKQPSGWREAIPRLHARGLTTAEIAAETGYSIRSVQEYLYRLGLRAHSPRGRATEEQVRAEVERQGGELSDRRVRALVGKPRKRLPLLVRKALHDEQRDRERDARAKAKREVRMRERLEAIASWQEQVERYLAELPRLIEAARPTAAAPMQQDALDLVLARVIDRVPSPELASARGISRDALHKRYQRGRALLERAGASAELLEWVEARMRMSWCAPISRREAAQIALTDRESSQVAQRAELLAWLRSLSREERQLEAPAALERWLTTIPAELVERARAEVSAYRAARPYHHQGGSRP